MIVSILGPAGSGKTTLCSLLEKDFSGLKIYTTRPRRIDDKDNYIFVSTRRFLSLYKKEKILTKAKILSNFYGLENCFISDDKVHVAVADWFTINQLRKKGIRHIAIYLDVPLDVCKDRLLARGDSLCSINKKIALERLMSQKEKALCSHIISNCESIEKTYGEVIQLINQGLSDNKGEARG